MWGVNFSLLIFLRKKKILKISVIDEHRVLLYELVEAIIVLKINNMLFNEIISDILIFIIKTTTEKTENVFCRVQNYIYSYKQEV